MNSGDRAVGLLVLINSPGRILQEGHIALTSAFFQVVFYRSHFLLLSPLAPSQSSQLLQLGLQLRKKQVYQGLQGPRGHSKQGLYIWEPWGPGSFLNVSKHNIMSQAAEAPLSLINYFAPVAWQ